MTNKLYVFHQSAGDTQFKYSSLNISSWSNEQSVQNQGGITDTPGAAVLDGVIYLFYSRNHAFYYNSSADGDTFPGEIRVPNTAGLAAGVAAVTYRGKIYLFYSNPGSTVLMCRTFDGTNFSPEAPLPPIPQAFAVESTPAAAVFNDILYVVCRGAEASSPGNHTRLWYCAFDGILWQTTRVDNTAGASEGAGACVYEGALYVFHTSPDGRFRFKTFDGATWSDDEQLVPNIGGVTSNPAVTTYDGKLYLLYQSKARPGGLYFKSFTSARWLDETPVPHSAGISAGPALALFDH
jgi:hypothetical protein